MSSPGCSPASARSRRRAIRPRLLRVYLRAGLKTHAPGQPDYPQFPADWSKILTERGAVVDGSLHFPTALELANVDVMFSYKGDAGDRTAEEKATPETFLKRGGGLIAMHDTICAADPEWFATIYGGAKKHGQTNFTREAPVAYTIADPANPIMQGRTDFTITDESFFLMTWAKSPQIKVLATAPQAMAGERPEAAGLQAGDQCLGDRRVLTGPRLEVQDKRDVGISGGEAPVLGLSASERKRSALGFTAQPAARIKEARLVEQDYLPVT